MPPVRTVGVCVCVCVCVCGDGDTLKFFSHGFSYIFLIKDIIFWNKTNLGMNTTSTYQ